MRLLNKPIYILLFLFSMLFSGNGKAQQVVFINVAMLDSAYQVNQYTLNAKELYGTDHTLELYNVWINDQYFMLFSVLPDFEQGGLWEEIVIGADHEIMDYNRFQETITSRIVDGKYFSKDFTFRLLKFEGNRYYQSKWCLFENFRVLQLPHPLNTPPNTLNLDRTPLTIRNMGREYAKLFPGSRFEINPWEFHFERDDFLYGYYLSGKMSIKGQTAYRFWTFSDYNMVDGFNVKRGVDRFIFIPGKGIVGGAYDFYFVFDNPWKPIAREKRYTISQEQWLKNILDEKVMLAEELKDIDSKQTQIP